LGSVSVSLDSGIIVSGFGRDMNGKMSQKQGMTKIRLNEENAKKTRNESVSDFSFQ
jgi:hypothetical protein